MAVSLAGSPMYLRLARELAQAIRSGCYWAGQTLPSERLLCESAKVSRDTARRAIGRLVEQRLVERRRGSGSYVMALPEVAARLPGTPEVVRGSGFTPTSRCLSKALGVSTQEEQAILGLSAGGRVLRHVQLHLADEVVVAHEFRVTPDRTLPAPARAVQRIRACNADAAMARAMQVPIGHALLLITRVAYLETGQAVELTRSHCRSDYLGLIVESRRISIGSG